MTSLRSFDFKISLSSGTPGDGISVRSGSISTPSFEVVHRGDWTVRQESSRFILETPGFPEGPACRIEGDASSFRVTTDHAGIATGFWTDRPLSDGNGVVASSRLADIEVGDRSLDGLALEEVGLLGHVLGDRTAVEGIHRTKATTCLSWSESTGARAESSALTSLIDLEPDPDVGSLIEGVGSLGASGEAIELTGGLDSRILLAIRTLAGRTPRVAITFGVPDNPDVRIAAVLAELFGIDHQVIPFGGECADLARRSVFNAAQAGGITDLKTYASFLSAFRRLTSEREEQIGGGGGEIAVDFYDVPLLTTMAKHGQPMPLIRQRMIHVPRFEAGRSPDGLDATVLRVATSVQELLDGYGDVDIHRRLRRFYFQERVGNWGGPVLNANRYNYTPLTPLLHSSYAAWANSLTRSQRSGRRAQEELLRQLVDRFGLDPMMLKVPFAGPRRGFHKMATLGWKYVRRLRGVDPRTNVIGRQVLDSWEGDQELMAILRRQPGVELFGQNYSPEELIRMSEFSSSLAGPLLSGLAALASNQLSRSTVSAGCGRTEEWC